MIRTAVVGCGYWGPNLVRNFYEIPGSRLLICCDQNAQKLEPMQLRYPTVKCTTDFDEVLNSEADAVAIATPIRTHHELASRALRAGKHVFVEKPLAFSYQQCLELVEISERQGKVLMVGHTFEYNPAVRKLKEIVDRGEVGAVRYVYSSRVNLGQVRADENALWNLAPHDISIFLYLLGSVPVRISARGRGYLNPAIEDVAFLYMEFPSGVIAHTHVSWLDPSKIRKMTVVGSEKMVIYDDMDSEGKLRIYDKGVVDLGQVYGEFHVKLRAGDILIPKLDQREPLRIECEHFLECIRKGLRPQSDGLSGARVVRILEAAQISMREGGREIALDQVRQ